jgi:3-isopropylmalate/(R)-2-methylmalate dehydratase small subunit
LNNFLLPVTVSESFLQLLFSAISKNPENEVEIDLAAQSIRLVSSGEEAFFDISAYKKTCLLNGYDDIDYLLSIKEEIEAFEKNSTNF